MLRTALIAAALGTSMAYTAIAGPSTQTVQPTPNEPQQSVSTIGTGSTLDGEIARLLENLPEDVRVYNDHVVTLSNPFMEGRIPGSRGMEIASQYIEYYYQQVGLEPAFPATSGPEQGRAFRSWRQPFNLGGTLEVTEQALRLVGADLELTAGLEYTPLALGEPGFVSAPVVYVGYSIDGGRDGYESYLPEDDLTGKIALITRFEPMNEAGKSSWSAEAWTEKAGFAQKVLSAVNRKAAAIVIANPPGCADERASSLNSVGSGRPIAQVPVFMMTHEAADRLVRAMDPQGRSWMDLRRLADQGRAFIPLNGTLEMQVAMENKPLVGENVGGVLRGKGALADQYVVLGAHLDHLGMGNFGSRTGPGRLHPGADDNASGCAAVIMLADRLAKSYAKLPPGTPARSILFLCFSGEESGLNGSAHYVNNAIAPIENHSLMINFDMIGRIKNGRLSVSGADTAKGLNDWLKRYFEDTPLTIQQPPVMSGASDHTPFFQKQIPVLFAIIADFHGDYHTPEDVSYKINREGAVQTIDLFQKILFAAALKMERFEYEAPAPRGGATAGSRRVRLGIVPDFGAGEENTDGVLVTGVTEGTPAAKAGIQGGDRLTAWNDEELANLQALTRLMSAAKPGDEVKLTLLRNGAEMAITVVLATNEDG